MRLWRFALLDSDRGCEVEASCEAYARVLASKQLGVGYTEPALVNAKTWRVRCVSCGRLVREAKLPNPLCDLCTQGAVP